MMSQLNTFSGKKSSSGRLWVVNQAKPSTDVFIRVSCTVETLRELYPSIYCLTEEDCMCVCVSVLVHGFACLHMCLFVCLCDFVNQQI